MKKHNKKLTLFEKYRNRVGVFADKVQQASQVPISEDKTKENSTDEVQLSSPQKIQSKSTKPQPKKSVNNGKVY